ncbi:zinc ribbon domain-containing protein [Nitrosopumilus ureiphilus]|uniref:zinc ribbon domain-containing protein n=1 Tax=Nitrosopumilus ureiphilus TaxID=1470067 RepID=UPI003CC91CED
MDGIPVVFVDPKRTSKLCPICGNRIQEYRQNRRKLLCTDCGKSMDRDVVASMNIAHKAWSRFNMLEMIQVKRSILLLRNQCRNPAMMMW